MQDYLEFAEKNGITLLNDGPCQFCGAETTRGVHECLEIFNLVVPAIDYSNADNHRYRFLMVDAHTLQHPEIHGRWNNHLHLSRLHLVFHYRVSWSYALTAKLSQCLNAYKADKPNEELTPPKVLERGKITTTDIRDNAKEPTEAKALITQWAEEVYHAWSDAHPVVDEIAKGFLGS
ncbi:MAG: DUF5946 family protein [Bacteroidota bacterium]